MCRWPHERTARRVSDSLLDSGRRKAVALGPAPWSGHHGRLVLAPPNAAGGGEVGDHIEFCFRAHGTSFALTLHAWSPLAQAIATLGRVVASAPG